MSLLFYLEVSRIIPRILSLTLALKIVFCLSFMGVFSRFVANLFCWPFSVSQAIWDCSFPDPLARCCHMLSYIAPHMRRFHFPPLGTNFSGVFYRLHYVFASAVRLPGVCRDACLFPKGKFSMPQSPRLQAGVFSYCCYDADVSGAFCGLVGYLRKTPSL